MTTIVSSASGRCITTLKTSLQPWSVAPSRYGFQPKKDDDPKPRMSFLPRTAALPPLQEHHFPDCPRDSPAFKLLESLWNGNLAFHIEEERGGNIKLKILEASNVPRMRKIIFLVHMEPYRDSESDPNMRLMASLGTQNIVLGTQLTAMDILNCDPECYDFLYKVLRGSARDLLVTRLLHHMLRQTGRSHVILDHLEVFYGNRRSWKELLDLAMCKVDILDFINTNPLDRAFAYEKLGKNLEANGDFLTAAQVFLNGSELNSINYIQNNFEEPVFLEAAKINSILQNKFAGFTVEALRKAGKFEDAEDILHCKARGYIDEFADGSLDFENSEIQDFFQHFLALYTSVENQPRLAPRLGTDFEKRHLIFMGLSIAAEFPGLMEFPPGVTENYTNLIQPCFRKPKKAKQALLQAILKPSCEAYRHQLLAFAIPSYLLALEMPILEAPPVAKPYTWEMRAKWELLRDHLRKCSNGDCPEWENAEEEFLKCPCNDGPRYCSKVCHRAHWRQHKLTCSIHATNKKKGNTQGRGSPTEDGK